MTRSLPPLTQPETDGAVVPIVGWAGMPPWVTAVDGLLDPSYADLFAIRTSGAARTPADAWARVVLEQTAVGQATPTLWRRLGLRLGPRPSPDHVQGWRIAARGEGWVRLETASWCMSAHAVVRVDDDELSLGLFVRFDRSIAALIWSPVAALHRRAVPVMLAQAVEVHDHRSTE